MVAQGGHGWQMVAPFYGGMQLQIARRLIMVESRSLRRRDF